MNILKIPVVTLSILVAITVSSARAQNTHTSLERCREIRDSLQRLTCYDNLSASAFVQKQDVATGARVFGPETLPSLDRITARFSSEYTKTGDEQARSELRIRRKQAVQDLFQNTKDLTFENWPGTVDHVVFSTGGDIILVVEFLGFSLKDDSIKKGTDLHNYLSSTGIKSGDAVVVSANARGGDALDYILEASWTPAGAMMDPEYKVRFKSIVSSR